jgi:hypothetical protein
MDKGARKMRECRHPDALWLSSLLPVERADVRQQQMQEALRDHLEDPRAAFLAWLLSFADDALLERAAESGYAPAQAQMAYNWSRSATPELGYDWARKASSQGNRRGLFQLGFCYYNGVGCAKNVEKGVQLYRAAAELNCAFAQFCLGHVVIVGEYDFERYYWLGRASQFEIYEFSFCDPILRLLPLFEKGRLCRILCAAAPVIREKAAFWNLDALGRRWSDPREKLLRVVWLHDTVLGRAKQVIACWGIVGRRCGLTRDVRVMNSKAGVARGVAFEMPE